jgi:hypothetical protein
MGVDIHGPFVEVRDGERWDSIATLNWYRNTMWFGILAGVRGGSPVVEPRGVPEDAGWAWVEHAEPYPGDCHSASWLTPDEIDRAWKRYRREARREFGKGAGVHPNGLDVLLAIFKALKNEEEVRVGFCFDS